MKEISNKVFSVYPCLSIAFFALFYEEWGGYVYRYYKQSNIYLGFFYEQEVHLNRVNVSNRIDVVGNVDFL